MINKSPESLANFLSKRFRDLVNDSGGPNQTLFLRVISATQHALAIKDIRPIQFSTSKTRT